MQEGRPLPLTDVTARAISLTINAEGRSTVSAPLFYGNYIGGGVSNSIDSAGPAPKRARVKCLDEVHGYVHYVSQLKPMSRRTSKEQKYFTSRLQRRSDYVRVVIFNQKSYSAFCHAQSERAPVRLNNIHFEESRQEVIFNQTSQLSCMQSLDFEYDSKSCEPKLVGSISEARQCSAGEWITITGKITEQQTHRDPHHKGKHQPLKYTLANRGASIPLTLWEDKWNINSGTWYTVSHVEVEQYQLNFTQYTTLTEVSAQEDEVDHLSRCKFKVLGASVKNCHLCSICEAELTLIDPNQISVECPVCKDRVLAESIRYVTKASITVKKFRGTTKFNIPQSCIKPLLGLEGPGFCDTEQAENKLLQMKMVEVVFCVRKVVEIKQATEDGDPD